MCQCHGYYDIQKGILAIVVYVEYVAYFKRKMRQELLV